MPSWWVDTPPEEFYQRARTEAERMRVEESAEAASYALQQLAREEQVLREGWHEGDAPGALLVARKRRSPPTTS